MAIAKQIVTQNIRNEALSLGFADCGFSKVRELSEVKPVYNSWINNGYHASMEYMDQNTEKRLNPELLVENAKTVISLLYNYYTTDKLEGEFRISRYAYGMDYHYVIKDKLKILDSYIKSLAENIQQRYFVDSAPVLERSWAQQSGLGWIGKNTCLISRKFGSFVFIAEIITSLELEYDEALKDYCGDCRLCIDICPTEAITDKRLIDSNKCISYQTIENKDEIDNRLAGKLENYIFGCDICQDVCPWNKKAHPHNEPLFHLNNELKQMTNENWQQLGKNDFQRIFRKSAVKRTKFKGLKRNIAFLKSRS